jgi:hypothetical protein
MKDAFDVWDQILHEVCLEHVDAEPYTAEELAWAESLAAATKEKIAAARRALVPAVAVPKQAAPIPASLLAMTRDALIAKIREVLDAAGGSIQLAYRDVSHQSDQDLRVLLAALQDAAQRRE